MNKSNYFYYFLKYKDCDTYILIEKTWFSKDGRVICFWGDPYKVYGQDLKVGLTIHDFTNTLGSMSKIVRRYVHKKNAVKYIHQFLEKNPELLV